MGAGAGIATQTGKALTGAASGAVSGSVVGKSPVRRLLSRPQKAAVIVRLLLSQGADLSLADLPQEVQDELVLEMARMRAVDQETLAAVVEEFIQSIECVGLTFQQGLAGALATLGGAISPVAADRMRRRAGPAAMGDPWDRIAELGADTLLPILSEESVEVGAVVLSKLKVSKAAELLGKMPGAKARRVAFAMSQTGSVRIDLVARIGRTLLDQIDATPAPAFRGGPVERVGAILNFSPAATRDDVLAGLDEADKSFAEEVRKAIFTFANIPDRIDPRDVPKVLRGLDQAVLTTALGADMAAGGQIAEFIFANMSQRMATTLKEEIEAMGKIKDKDAEAAMSAVVAAIRELEAGGDLVLVVPEE